MLDYGEIVNNSKHIFFFLINKKTRNQQRKPDTLGREPILTYVIAVVDLYNKQKAFASNQHPPAKPFG